MNVGATLLLIVFLIAPPLFASDKTDVLVMKNGDQKCQADFRRWEIAKDHRRVITRDRTASGNTEK